MSAESGHISLTRMAVISTPSFTGKERDEETGYGYFGARYYDCDLSGLFLSVDPMADKYPSISPYAYCAWNPVKLVDPDGADIYMLFYVTGNKKGNGMFKAAAETRKKELEEKRGFNPEKDIVLMFELKDIGQMKDIVGEAIKTYSEQYGQTAEVGVWSHAGCDGPIGSKPTTGDYALDGYQMTLDGWNKIDFNWNENANMVFYGCNTGNDDCYDESFSCNISSLSNYRGVNVWGQKSSAYPSSSPYERATNLAKSIGYGYGIGNTYMVGGNANQGKQSLWFMPGVYPAANQMNVYKNGRWVRSAFQNR
jgi:RHS repeat-associated protein